jgi:hypothetical protein
VAHDLSGAMGSDSLLGYCWRIQEDRQVCGRPEGGEEVQSHFPKPCCGTAEGGAGNLRRNGGSYCLRILAKLFNKWLARSPWTGI